MPLHGPQAKAGRRCSTPLRWPTQRLSSGNGPSTTPSARAQTIERCRLTLHQQPGRGALPVPGPVLAAVPGDAYRCSTQTGGWWRAQCHQRHELALVHINRERTLGGDLYLLPCAQFVDDLHCMGQRGVGLRQARQRGRGQNGRSGQRTGTHGANIRSVVLPRLAHGNEPLCGPVHCTKGTGWCRIALRVLARRCTWHIAPRKKAAPHQGTRLRARRGRARVRTWRPVQLQRQVPACWEGCWLCQVASVHQQPLQAWPLAACRRRDQGPCMQHQ